MQNREKKNNNLKYLLFQCYQIEIIGADFSHAQIHHKKKIIEKAELRLNKQACSHPQVFPIQCNILKFYF